MRAQIICLHIRLTVAVHVSGFVAVQLYPGFNINGVFFFVQLVYGTNDGK